MSISEKCASCKVIMDVANPFFICVACVRKLPDDLRVSVLGAEAWQSEPRVAALKFLGAADTNDVRCSRKPYERSETCMCVRAGRKVEFQYVLGGGEVAICAKCQRRIA